MNEQLQKIIDKMVEEKTFSGEGIKHIAALQEELGKLETYARSQDDEIKSLKADKSEVRQQLAERNEEIDGLKVKLSNAEKQIEGLESAKVEAAVATAKADTIKGCFELVFRNQQVHRRVASTVPINESYTHSDSYGNPTTSNNVNYHQSTEQIVEEVK